MDGAAAVPKAPGFWQKFAAGLTPQGQEWVARQGLSQQQAAMEQQRMQAAQQMLQMLFGGGVPPTTAPAVAPFAGATPTPSGSPIPGALFESPPMLPSAPTAPMPAPMAAGGGLPAGASVSVPLGKGLPTITARGPSRREAGEAAIDERLLQLFTEGAQGGLSPEQAVNFAITRYTREQPFEFARRAPATTQMRANLAAGLPGAEAQQRGVATGDPGARASYLAQAKGLVPGTPDFEADVQATLNEITRTTATARATGAVEAPARPSGQERATLVQALDLAQVVVDLGQRFATAQKAIGPIASRVARLKDLAGTNPQAYSAFLAANQTLINTIIYLRSGKQINENEAKRLLRELPVETISPAAWQARFGNAVRTIYRNMKSRQRVSQASNLIGSDAYDEVMMNLEGAFPQFLGGVTARALPPRPTAKTPTAAPTAPTAPPTPKEREPLDALIQRYQ